jgi:hypothetical protein
VTTNYVEAELALEAAAKAKFTSARVSTETPSNLADVLPCIVIQRFGGAEDEVYTFDNANIDFEVYAATRAAARTLAHQVRTWVRKDLPGSIISGAAVSRTRTISGPAWVPYANTTVRKFIYSATIRLHSPEAS